MLDLDKYFSKIYKTLTSLVSIEFFSPFQSKRCSSFILCKQREEVWESAGEMI